MMVDLNTIRYDVPEFKKKKGVQVKISPEDAFMIAGI